MRSNLASASPAAFTSADDEEFFGAIDRLTVSWGHVEIGRERLLHIVHQDLNGRERIGTEAPLSRQRKLRYLRRAFPTLAELQTFSARFAKLADETSAAADAHAIIRGFVVGMPKARAKPLWRRDAAGQKG